MSIKIKVGSLIVKKGKILLIKEKIEKNNVPLWNIVKGTYEENSDETIFDAATRECREEALVEVKLISTLGCYIARRNNKVRVQFNFLAEIVNGTPSLPDKKEQVKRDECISKLKWFSKEEISQMNPNEFISNRTYLVLMDWIKDNRYPLEIFKNISM